MSNIVFMMLFTGIILLYIDMKLGSEKSTKDKKDNETKELHERITDMYSGSADIFRPMFNTKIDDLWSSSK